MTAGRTLATLALMLAPLGALADRLEEVTARGTLRCGIEEGLYGFAAEGAGGQWLGFDVDLCRAVAAAVLGDAGKVEMVPLPPDGSLPPDLLAGLDLLARDGGWSATADAGDGLDVVATTLFDGIGLMVPAELGVASAEELMEVTVCVTEGDVAGAALSDYAATRALALTLAPQPGIEAMLAAYQAGTCGALASSFARLAALRATFEDPARHILLPELIAKDPFGLAVPEGDARWADIVRWSFFALIAAEELGVTSANVTEMALAPTATPEVNRLLGTEGEIGALLGLSPDWAARIIASVGNYSEIFETNIGETTPIGLARGLNALWTRGGLQIAPPFR